MAAGDTPATGERQVQGEASASLLLRQAAGRFPDRPFVDDRLHPLSYGEFDRLADGVAVELLDALGSAARPVVICCRQLAALSVAALGASRAGKIVAIQDPAIPITRLLGILSDLEAPLVLTDFLDEPVVNLPCVQPMHVEVGGASALPGQQAEVASIVYTSGSTGVPKGVMIPATARDALGEGLAVFGDLGGARVAYFTGNSWGDAIVHGAIMCEATLVPYDVSASGINPLPAWLAEKEIAGIATVPTLLRALLGRLGSDEILAALRLVVSNGEALHWSDVNRLRRHVPSDALIFNVFGTTESGSIAASIIAADTALGVGPVDPGTIMPSVEVEIVDAAGHAVPVGGSGEIVATSNTVMLGYWRRPAETARVLTALPDGRRRLRTGDGGRILPDGTLQHLGRLDHVVKVSGHRVELGEVEAGLCALDGVRSAAAVTYEDKAGDTRLVAYVTSVGGTLSPTLLRAGLAGSVPTWMVPDRVTVVDELPQLANGKIDRLSLKGPPARPASRSVPIDGLVSALIDLWAATLDQEDLGPDDNFFDAGGDSMRAAYLFAAIAEELGYDKPVATLVQHPTPRLLAEALRTAVDDGGHLIHLNAEGSKTPLVVIHDGLGDVFYVHRLSTELGSDQPVLAIRGIALEGKRLHHDSIESLASHYLALVRSVVKEGPWRLLGGSLGGLIAFEMALQLQSEGFDVDQLLLGDTSWPGDDHSVGHIPRASRLREAMSHRRWFSALRIVRDHVGWRLRQVREARAWRRTATLAASGEPIPPDRRERFALYEYGIRALRYQPGARFAGPATLLRAGGPGERPDRGWAPHLAQEMRVIDVGCTHTDLAREAGVTEIVSALAL